MTSADSFFRQLLKDLRPSLARAGFRRTSQNFVIETPECWGIINFQKSLYSSAKEKKFTVNLAIASKRIFRFQGEPDNKPPRYYASHWQIRLGELAPTHSDLWWTLSDETSYKTVLPELEQLITVIAIPVIKSHLTEVTLLALWEEIFGGFEYPVLKYKSILLAERGQFNQLPAIFQRIREICQGGLAEPGAEQHIARLKRHYGIQVE
jgi:hypothetical protein